MNINPKHDAPAKTQKREKKIKPPKKITPSYVQNSGLYYLQRFASSRANFVAVMTRKAKRSCAFHTDQDFEECVRIIEEVASRFEELGLLNDEAYTKGMVTSLRRSGKSKRAITMKLSSKGLNRDDIERALMTHDTQDHDTQNDAEREAALTFAKKKRIGPFRNKKVEDEQKTLHKELSALARAGYSYDTCRFILEANIEDYG